MWPTCITTSLGSPMTDAAHLFNDMAGFLISMIPGTPTRTVRVDLIPDSATICFGCQHPGVLGTL